MLGPLGSGWGACPAGYPLEGVGEGGQDKGTNLTSCLGRRGRPRGGDGGAGAGGMAGGSWRADESHPEALKGWRYSGSFHLRLRGSHWTQRCLHPELLGWAHTALHSPPHGSSDTQLVTSEH